MSLSSSAGGPSVPSPTEPFYPPAGSAHAEGSQKVPLSKSSVLSGTQTWTEGAEQDERLLAAFPPPSDEDRLHLHPPTSN